MITLGVDPGSIVTGYGVIGKSEAGFRVFDYSAIRPGGKCDFPQRIKYIYDTLEKVICAYKPTQLSLETAFYGKNAQSALKLGQVRGAIIILAMNYNLKFVEYSPREVKKSVAGTGNASKEQVAYMVKKMLSIDDEKMALDTSDALAIALCGHFKSASMAASEFKKQSRKATSWGEYILQNPQVVVK
ncbi:crossover junction endodeoxyribonuclease RuvC [Chloroherpeton thalassium ATCC 35110]|uniref:Crossover junction endodeoxyribonuclease RuvC n=1 Tax=Chloroherpeton thalassium (strain ATCC 35110 / GB-78) TaxID=517418 RepID=RUVC_CHLT3|nr:crossover junction endodeoxyribonuclease RuvC [Chloroherpeton thalassium]B3QTP6.1 RecName: Full=Crossover junction endodeoxyribonuclease RuvC; AltName: Full=Holliday junction nuclease RuvC; AltName: Full=Holliday junction resolvase RuvC [Chloroherpeton thalassium ATCC 35110]ACF14244.1 crossover junction endodeoxyribonuclease RuvC [Chloroherpeton thalassium ATCC 35110]